MVIIQSTRSIYHICSKKLFFENDRRQTKNPEAAQEKVKKVDKLVLGNRTKSGETRKKSNR